jgi:hypothetical protein
MSDTIDDQVRYEPGKEIATDQLKDRLRYEWRHGPDADPDPVVAQAIALITECQLGTLSDAEQHEMQHRLTTDLEFASTAAPLLVAIQALRDNAEMERRSVGEPARVAKVIAQIEAERETHRELHPSRPRHRTHGWLRVRHPMWQLAASLLIAFTIALCAVNAYGAVLRSRIHPVSVTFTNAPLSVVMAELRRRYHIGVEVCDVGFNQDRVTMTVTDAPIESVANIIGQQTLRWAHWKASYTGGPYTLLLQPQPDMDRGWWYNLRLVARSFTYLGCHR